MNDQSSSKPAQQGTDNLVEHYRTTGPAYLAAAVRFNNHPQMEGSRPPKDKANQQQG